MRQILPVLGLVVATGLAVVGCSDPADDVGPHDTSGNDDGGGGDSTGSCTTGRDCPTGQVCVDGHCVGGADADADGDATGEADACFQNIDIVFVIDVSTSMTSTLDSLYNGIADVWSAALGLDPAAQFGLVVFVDDVMVTNDGNWYASLTDIQDQFSYWRGFCAGNSEPGGSPGFNNDCPENSLDAIWEGATRFAWRENALRVIFHATDDTFVEGPGTLGTYGIMVGHTYSQVLTELLARQVRVAAFAAHDSSDCSIPPLHNTEPGFFGPWGPDPALPEATGAAVFDIREVRAGALSMSEAINGVILEEYCTPFII